MKSLEEQIASKCVHFNGMQNNVCEAGVIYETVKDATAKGFACFPCFRDGSSLPCPKQHFPTPEEVAAEAAADRALMERCSKGIKAAMEAAKAAGFKKGSGGRGEVKCPCCEAGTLHYSVASYNGHIHGRCSTAGCVSWMQ